MTPVLTLAALDRGSREDGGPLFDALFGPTGTTPEKPLRTYLLVDATLRANVLGSFDLDAPGVPVRCLFQGKAAQEFEKAAPYLLDYTLPETWRDHLPSPHRQLLEAHWGHQSGVVIRTEASIEELRKHLRRFTRMQRSDNGEWVLFRYWDARTALPYFEALSNLPTQAAAWFVPEGGPVIEALVIEGDGPDQGWSVTPATDLSAEGRRPIPSLSEPELSALRSAKETQFVRNVARGLAQVERPGPTLPHAQWQAFVRSVIPLARAADLRTQQGIARFALLALTLGPWFLNDPRFPADTRALMLSRRLTQGEFFETGRALQDDHMARLEADGGVRAIHARAATLLHGGRDMAPDQILRNVAENVAAPLEEGQANAVAAALMERHPRLMELPVARRQIAIALAACHGIGWPSDPRWKDLALALTIGSEADLLVALTMDDPQ